MRRLVIFGPEGSSPRNGKLALLTLPPGQYRFVQAFGYYNEFGMSFSS